MMLEIDDPRPFYHLREEMRSTWVKSRLTPVGMNGMLDA
jgi:hypothetical protein